MKKVVKIITMLIICISLLISLCIFAVNYFFPIKYKEEVIKYSQEYEIDPYLIYAIINVESKFNKDAKSSKDARGLMQIREITGKWASDNIELLEELEEEEYFNPDSNIKVGCWYLSRLKAQYSNNIALMIAAYNAGIGNVNKWIESGMDVENGDIPFKETKEYVIKVKSNMKIYKMIYPNENK